MSFLNATTTLLLVAGVTALVVVLIATRATRQRKRVLDRFVGPGMIGPLTTSLAPGRRRLRQTLFAVGLVFLLAATARPWWGTRLVPTPRRTRDILIAVDCSRSMLAADVAPSRLEHAKWWIRELIAGCEGDRFGLIAFAGDAFLECPLTTDRNTLFQFLDDMDTDTIPVGGTNLAQALRTAWEAFKGAEGGHRALVLVSDGEELQGEADAEIELFTENEIPLFVVGLGDPVHGSVIHLPDRTLVRDAGGDVVTTRLDESGLRRLSDATAGIYVRSTTVTPNTKPVLRRVRQLVPEEHEAATVRRPIERYQVPLVLGLICFLARFLVSERRSQTPRTTRSPALILAVYGLITLAATNGVPSAGAQQILDLPAQDSPAATHGNATAPDLPPSTRPQQPGAGDQGERERQLRQEILELEELLEKTEGRLRDGLLFNLGYLHHQLGDLDQAEAAYTAAAGADDAPDRVRAAASRNLGIVWHTRARTKAAESPKEALECLEKAEEWYCQALRLAPEERDTAFNQGLLVREHERLQALVKWQEEFEAALDKAVRETREAVQAQEHANTLPGGDSGAYAQAQNTAIDQRTEAVAPVESLQALCAQMEQQTPVPDPDTALRELDAAHAAQEQTLRLDNEALTAARDKAADHLRAALLALTGPEQEDQENQQEQEQDQDQEQEDPQQEEQQQQSPSEQNEQQQERQPSSEQNEQQQEQNSADNGEKQQEEPLFDEDEGSEEEQQPPPSAGAEESQASEPEDGTRFDEAHALTLLQQMQQYEQDLREAMKEQRKRNREMDSVEKDW
jgi:Ca-activated chloride channel family protein